MGPKKHWRRIQNVKKPSWRQSHKKAKYSRKQKGERHEDKNSKTPKEEIKGADWGWEHQDSNEKSWHQKEEIDWGWEHQDSNEESWHQKHKSSKKPKEEIEENDWGWEHQDSNEESWHQKHKSSKKPKEEIEENDWGWEHQDSNEESWHQKHKSSKKPKEEIEENDWGWKHQDSNEKSWNRKCNHWQDTYLKKENEGNMDDRVARNDKDPNSHGHKGACQKPLPAAKRLCPNCPMCQQAVKTKQKVRKTQEKNNQVRKTQEKNNQKHEVEMIEVEVEEEPQEPREKMVYGASPKSKARGGKSNWQVSLVGHNPNRKIPRPILRPQNVFRIERQKPPGLIPPPNIRKPQVVPPRRRALEKVAADQVKCSTAVGAGVGTGLNASADPERFKKDMVYLRDVAKALGVKLRVEDEPGESPLAPTTTTSALDGSGQDLAGSDGGALPVGCLMPSRSVVSPTSNVKPPHAATSTPMTPAKTGVQQFMDVKTELGATPHVKPSRAVACDQMAPAQISVQQFMDVKTESGATPQVKPSRAVAHAQMTQAETSVQLFMDVKTESGAARRVRPSMAAATCAPMAPAKTDVQQFEDVKSEHAVEMDMGYTSDVSI